MLLSWPGGERFPARRAAIASLKGAANAIESADFNGESPQKSPQSEDERTPILN